jgi:4-amino-4-deoxy-L-arabinose transferase-like glycosyltransferase
MVERREPFTRWEVAAVLAILLVAAVARMGWPGMTEFKADEGRLLTMALDMSDGMFAVRGISSSVGFPNSPMSVWLYSLPLFIWPHPIAATLFTGLLATLAVAATYWMARRYWGVHAALAAALMFVVGPWAIIFSRKIWAQNLLPIFVVGWAAAAALAFVDGKRPYLVLHLVCLAIAIQIHFAAIVLLPVTLLCLIVFRRRVSPGYLIMGALLSLLTAAPFIWYLSGHWRVASGLSLSTGQAASIVSLESLGHSLTIAMGNGIHTLAGPIYAEQLWWRPALILVYLLWGSLLIGGVIHLVKGVARRWSSAEAQVGFIWLAWLLLPALVFLYQWASIYIHYFIAVLPAPYLVAGVGFNRLLAGKRIALKSAGWIALVIAAGIQLFTVGATLNYVAAHPLEGGFGVPLATKLAVADDARRLMMETGAAEVLVAGDGSYPGQDDFPAEFNALLHDLPRRFVDLNREALFPATSSIVIMDTAQHDRATSTRELYRVAARNRNPDPVAGDDLAYEVLDMPPSAAPEPGIRMPEAALLANFVRIIGYEPLRMDRAGVWDVYWHPADQADPADYHFFNHLIDANGARVAQDDAAVFATSQWRPGDTVISRFVLAPDADASRSWQVLTGMYRYPSLEAVPILDEAANPAGDYLVLDAEGK